MNALLPTRTLCLALIASLSLGAVVARLPAQAPAGDPPPAKALLAVALTDDVVRLEASIHGGSDATPALWGAILASASGAVAAPLPGLEILAEPEVLAAGPIVDGMFALTAARPAEGVFHLQAVVLHGDLSFTASEVAKLDLAPDAGVDGGEGATPPAVLERLALSVEVMESEPPQYAIAARFEADSDGYALLALGTVEAGNGQTVARFALKVPGPGEGMLDIAQTLQARVALGKASATDARVEVAVVEELRDGPDLKFYPVAIDG